MADEQIQAPAAAAEIKPEPAPEEVAAPAEPAVAAPAEAASAEAAPAVVEAAEPAPAETAAPAQAAPPVREPKPPQQARRESARGEQGKREEGRKDETRKEEGKREEGRRDARPLREGRGPRGENQGGSRPDGRSEGRREDRRGGGGGRPDLALDIDLDKLIADSLYLDNQAHAVVARMRDMDSGTKSQLRRFYNAVRRAVRAPENERQHQFVMLRARLAYTIARHSLRSLDALEKLLLQVTRKNDARGYERFRDLFEAIVAYNE